MGRADPLPGLRPAVRGPGPPKQQDRAGSPARSRFFSEPDLLPFPWNKVRLKAGHLHLHGAPPHMR